MRHNAGRIDRSLRFLISLIIIAAGIYYQSLWGIVGIIPLVSGVTGFCPLYSIFGISTCHYEVESNKTERLHLKT
ncbi:MAG: YgaP family membrane protein [Candidatus Halalkalibacterium sp. M3_1C_030]